jgi:muramoyltetrapeptide carboxypeptidase LdcA involved in peptidoglycan recycling
MDKAMLNLKKPRHLEPGSRVAVVTPSWGGPATVPLRFERGLRELRERFGLDVVEMPHTRADAEWVWRNPQARADDINAAFSERSIDGVIASIGGDDSVRILPHIDTSVIADNPKVFMGYSDTTTLHVLALQCGLQTFYGPSVLAGIAENGGTFPYTESWVRRTLMSARPVGELAPSDKWTDENVAWENEELAGQRRATKPNNGWKWLQGGRRVEGHLVGGCLDVLEFLKGTRWWPAPQAWDGAVFYWETSEDAPSTTLVAWWLRNYGMQGILERLSGMIVGRSAHYTPEQVEERDKMILRIVRDEFGLVHLPIAVDLDFGHTDPQMVLPNGGKVVLDPAAGTISLPDPATL